MDVVQPNPVQYPRVQNTQSTMMLARGQHGSSSVFRNFINRFRLRVSTIVSARNSGLTVREEVFANSYSRYLVILQNFVELERSIGEQIIWKELYELHMIYRQKRQRQWGQRRFFEFALKHLVDSIESGRLYYSWVRDLTRENIESNPGPVQDLVNKFIFTDSLYFASNNMFDLLDDDDTTVFISLDRVVLRVEGEICEDVEHVYDEEVFSDLEILSFDDEDLEIQSGEDLIQSSSSEEDLSDYDSSSDASSDLYGSNMSSNFDTFSFDSDASGNTWCTDEDIQSEVDEEERERQFSLFFRNKCYEDALSTYNLGQEYLYTYFSRRWFEFEDTEYDFIISEIERSSTILDSMGGWIRDLTEEGVEPNPGPTNLFVLTYLRDLFYKYSFQVVLIEAQEYFRLVRIIFFGLYDLYWICEFLLPGMFGNIKIVRFIDGLYINYMIWSYFFACLSGRLGDTYMFRLNGWIRDLTREGVEPNPGPSAQAHKLSRFVYFQGKRREASINIVESLLILYYQLLRGRNRVDVLVAVSSYIKNQFRCNLTTSNGTILIIAKAEQVLDMFIQADDESTFIDVLKDLLDRYELVRESMMYKKIYKLFMYLLSLSVFEQLGVTMDSVNYTKLEQEAIKRKYHMGSDFIHCLLDTMVFLYTRGSQCLKMGSLDPIYHDEIFYSKWALKVYDLKNKSLHLSNPEPHNFTMYDYLSDLKHCIDEGRIMYRSLKSGDKTAKAFIGKLVGELEILNGNAISRREAQKSREAPFAILLHGGSSIAKSTLTQLLFNYFGKLHNLPIDDEYIYTRNPADEYWVNFNTTQWCVLMDDIAYLHPNKSTNVDKTLNEIIQVVNSTAFVPTQAALEDKGRTPMRAKLVLATTNSKDIHANAYFSCPLAVQRRLPFVISVKPKVEYSIHGCMLDGSKVPGLTDEDYPDYWDFEIFKVVPHDLNEEGGRQFAQHQLIHQFEDINSLLQWFGKTTKHFLDIQKKELGCKALMKNIDVCNICCMPIKHCECQLDIQSDEVGDLTQHSDGVREERIELPHNDWIHCIKERLIILVIWTYFYVPLVGDMMLYKALNYVAESLLDNYPLASASLAYHVGLRQRARMGGLSMENVKIFVSIASAMILGSFLYKSIFKGYESDEFVAQGSRGSRPEKDKEQVDNVWYKDDYMVTSLDISRVSSSMKGLGWEKVKQLLFENCVTIVSSSKDHSNTWTSRGFCVGGQFFLFNNHSIPNYTNHVVRLVVNDNHDGVREHYKAIPLSDRMIYRMPEKDLCMIWFPQVRNRRNYVELFCKSTLGGVHRGHLMGRDDTGAVYTNEVHRITGGIQNIGSLNVTTHVWYMVAQKPTSNGDCGSLCVSFGNNGPIIHGIHVAMNKDGTLLSVRTTYEDIKMMTAQFDVPLVQSGAINYTSTSSPQQLVDVNNKAEVRFIPEGNALVYGSFSGHRTKPKSKVDVSPLSYVLSDYGYKVTHGPPVMRGWEPWYNNLLPSLNSDTLIDVTLIMHCADSFANDMIKGFSKEELSKIMVYDDFTVTNGAAGVRFVDKMNRNTSAGFPFNKSKRYFINPIDPQHDLQDPVEFNEEIKERIRICEENYDNLTQYHPIYMASLKDEPRSFKKIKEKNTRVFTGGPVEHIFVTRRELLSYTKMIQENKYVSECAAGTIAQSTEWNSIYEYLTYFGKERIFDGDHSKFDKSMESVAILAVFRTITRVLEAAGASEEHINRCWCIGYDLAFAVINFNGTLLQLCKGHVSGEALTVLVNSHCNSLYLRYAYALQNGRSCVDFKKNVALMTYGDDFVGGVNPSCKFFNFRILKTNLEKIGLKITPADKEGADYDLMSIDRINFLKRSFRFDNILGKIVCPLEEESIRKSLMVIVESKTIPPEMQSAQCVGSAVREYFWYGKDRFEQEREFLKHIVSLCPEVELYVDGSTFPTWNELANSYWECSVHVDKFNAYEHFLKYT